jgi:hypothetical protein
MHNVLAIAQCKEKETLLGKNKNICLIQIPVM